MINALRQQIDQLGATASVAADGHMPIVAPGSPTPMDVNSTTPTTPTSLQPHMMSPPASSLVEVVDVLNRYNDQPVCHLAGDIEAVTVCLQGALPE